MRECDTPQTRSIKANSAVDLSRKPELDLCCDLLQHLQGVQRTCSFWAFSSSYMYIVFARLITQIVFQIKFSCYVDGSFCSIFLFCLTCNSSIMHILPLPPCGLYSIRAQNGYGQHRPCEIVLLTLITPRGVTDLRLSWGKNTEHARTAYHKTCGTEYEQPYRRCNSLTPCFNWNIAQARPMNVSDVSRSLQSWVSTIQSVVLTADVFQLFIKFYHKTCWNWVSTTIS